MNGDLTRDDRLILQWVLENLLTEDSTKFPVAAPETANGRIVEYYYGPDKQRVPLVPVATLTEKQKCESSRLLKLAAARFSQIADAMQR
jgi:hypothetical protein